MGTHSAPGSAKGCGPALSMTAATLVVLGHLLSALPYSDNWGTVPKRRGC